MAGVDAPAGGREPQLQQLRHHQPAAAAAGQPRELILYAAAHVGVLGAHGAPRRPGAVLGASKEGGVASRWGTEMVQRVTDRLSASTRQWWLGSQL